jgi:hypothetical protein
MTELEEMEGEQGSLRFPSMDILRDRQIVRGMEEKDKRRKGYESMRRNEERKKNFKEAIKKKRDKGLYNRISSMNYWDDASPAFKKRREEDSKKRRFKKRSSSSFSIPL